MRRLFWFTLTLVAVIVLSSGCTDQGSSDSVRTSSDQATPVSTTMTEQVSDEPYMATQNHIVILTDLTGPEYAPQETRPFLKYGCNTTISATENNRTPLFVHSETTDVVMYAIGAEPQSFHSPKPIVLQPGVNEIQIPKIYLSKLGGVGGEYPMSIGSVYDGRVHDYKMVFITSSPCKN